MDPTRETTTRSSEQGFTLVELMTALTITVVLTGAMLGLGQRAQAGATRVTRDVEVLESWRDTLAQIAQDLRCASTVASGGGRVVLTGGPNDVMWSVRQGHLTRSEGEGRRATSPASPISASTPRVRCTGSNSPSTAPTTAG